MEEPENFLKIYKNVTLEGKTLVLDYHSYENCIIKKCKLIYGGGPYHLIGCTIGENNFFFRDAALRTVNLYQTFLGGPPGVDEKGNIKM
jgi:hypothetical protein